MATEVAPLTPVLEEIALPLMAETEAQPQEDFSARIQSLGHYIVGFAQNTAESLGDKIESLGRTSDLASDAPFTAKEKLSHNVASRVAVLASATSFLIGAAAAENLNPAEGATVKATPNHQKSAPRMNVISTIKRIQEDIAAQPIAEDEHIKLTPPREIVSDLQKSYVVAIGTLLNVKGKRSAAAKSFRLTVNKDYRLPIYSLGYKYRLENFHYASGEWGKIEVDKKDLGTYIVSPNLVTRTITTVRLGVIKNKKWQAISNAVRLQPKNISYAFGSAEGVNRIDGYVKGKGIGDDYKKTTKLETVFKLKDSAASLARTGIYPRIRSSWSPVKPSYGSNSGYYIATFGPAKSRKQVQALKYVSNLSSFHKNK